MNSLQRYSMLFLFFFISFTASAIVSRDKCQDLNFCSHKGYCLAKDNTTSCVCTAGYFSQDCGKSLKDLMPAGWFSVRFIYAAIYAFLAVFAFISLYFSPKGSNAQLESLSFFNMRKVALLISMVITLLNLFYYLADPRAFDGRIPYMLSCIVMNLIYPLTSILFGCIIVHWFEVYRKTVSSLKQEQMKMRINSKYQGEVTLESVLEKIEVYNRIKIAFLVVNIAFLLLSFAYSIVTSLVYTNNLTSVDPLQFDIAFFAVFFILYLSEAIGFLITGRKLVQLMPPQLAKKMKRVTFKLNILSWMLVVACIVLIPLYLAKSDSPEIYLGVVWVLSELVFISILACMISLFIKWESKFPYCFSKESSRSSHNSTKSHEPKQSHSSEISLDVQE